MRPIAREAFEKEPQPSDTPLLSGRLELSWTNKGARLLSTDDESYQWLPPNDYRISEVRLLRDRITIGQCAKSRTDDNLLIAGDALNALTSLTRLPEFKKKFAGRIKLVYIDPPFNTGKAFKQYDDALEHSVWLTMLRDRLKQIQELLSEDGSVWLHLNDDEIHRARCVMDEVFGMGLFRACFIWQRVDSPSDNKVPVATNHDYILCYANKSVLRDWSPMPDPSILDAYGSEDQNGKLYRDRLLKKNGKNSLRKDRPSMYFPIEAPDGTIIFPIHDDGREACWAMGETEVRKAEAAKTLIWKQRTVKETGETRWVPYTREYAPDVPIKPWPTIWDDVNTMRQAKAHLKAVLPGVEPFDTPKPEELMERILRIATKKGDIVLDCFGGSGTTATTAHKMGRKWILIERSDENVEAHALPRLTKVCDGADAGGITESVEWQGGGGFRVLDVAPSMFQEDDGQVYLADWATNDALGEATAAQLGYEFQNDAPFFGRKGRTLLAVIDGVVTDGVVRLVVAALPPGAKVTIAGTAIDPLARQTLKRLRPGSTLRKIPASILDEYRLHNTIPEFEGYLQLADTSSEAEAAK